MRWLRSWYYRRCRQIDMRTLWPACLQCAPDVETAKAAFAAHALSDEAWLSLGEDWVIRFIDELSAAESGR